MPTAHSLSKGHTCLLFTIVGLLVAASLRRQNRPDDAKLSRLSRGKAIKLRQACSWCERDQLSTRRTASASWLAFRVAYAWVARGRVSSVVYSQRDVLLAFMWASHRAAVSSGLVWGLGVRPSEGGLALRAQRQTYGISLLLFPSQN